MTVDYAAVTQRQKKVWGMGDYAHIASVVSPIADRLVESLDIRPGQRVLDVAAGSGNAALAAARRFADVLATDYVPDLLGVAEKRAELEGLDVRTEVADAQHLPYDEGSFDVVVSAIGAMFAPDQERVADELVRVCRPGGRIGVASWTPDSIIGDMFRTVGRHVPPPPGVKPPVLWGDEARIRELFGDRVEIAATRRTFSWRWPSARFMAEYFERWYGPTIAAFGAVGPDGHDALLEDLEKTFAEHNVADDGTFAADAAFLEVIATKR
jgi:ubiquinone/menaquinone biosynthesis C-methylase UbiE